MLIDECRLHSTSQVAGATFWKEVTFKLKEPWEGLLKYDKIVNGAG